MPRDQLELLLIVRRELLAIRDQLQPGILDMADLRHGEASPNATAIALSVQEAINNIDLAIKSEGKVRDPDAG